MPHARKRNGGRYADGTLLDDMLEDEVVLPEQFFGEPKALNGICSLASAVLRLAARDRERYRIYLAGKIPGEEMLSDGWTLEVGEEAQVWLSDLGDEEEPFTLAWVAFVLLGESSRPQSTHLRGRQQPGTTCGRETG